MIIIVYNLKNNPTTLPYKKEKVPLTHLKTRSHAHCSMICDITNILELNLRPVNDLKKFDMQTYNFKQTNNESGQHNAVEDILFWAGKLWKCTIFTCLKILNFLWEKMDMLLRIYKKLNGFFCGKKLLDTIYSLKQSNFKCLNAWLEWILMGCSHTMAHFVFHFLQYLSMTVHACVFTWTCVPSMGMVRSEGSQTTAAWTCLRWNGRIKMTRWDTYNNLC